MDSRFLDELKRYIAFTDENARTLASLKPLFEQNSRRIVDVFYDRLLEHPRASRSITGGTAQIERLKQTLRRWLVELADGEYGQGYLEKRALIGKRHVIIDLPQEFMVTAMNVVRIELLRAIRATIADAETRERAIDATHKILDIDLALMLETYHEDSMEKVRRSERRAMIGELAGKVNHELRHRLGTIKSSAFLLEKLLADAPEQVTKHLHRVQQGAERAGATVSALLNLARELAPHMVAADLNHLVREAVAQVSTRPDIPFELELAPTSPRVNGDPELLVSLISNLVENAVESHNGTGGRVIVRTGTDDGTALVRVLDEGKGIAPDAAPHIFEPFFTTKENGTGLGLTIAQEIVHAHGGKIEAHSRADRSGTEFVVELKLEGGRR